MEESKALVLVASFEATRWPETAPDTAANRLCCGRRSWLVSRWNLWARESEMTFFVAHTSPN